VDQRFFRVLDRAFDGPQLLRMPRFAALDLIFCNYPSTRLRRLMIAG
jgi:hypothetical protein